MNLGPESETTEYKKTTSELKEGMSSIAAILNKHGHGELYFGVKNNGEICGMQVADTTLREISQAISYSIEPRIYPSIERLSDGEGHDYVLVSFEGNDVPYANKGTYRIRVADEDVLMSGEQVRRMASAAFLKDNPWDAQSSTRTLSDINEDTLRAFVARGMEKKRIQGPYAGVRNTLASLDLLVGDALTNAACVLFCDSDDVRLKMGILESHSRTEILDLHQEGGNVFDLIDKAQTYILNNTRRRFIIDGFGPRKEVPELPAAAIRESLVNAFVHRDWTKSASVQIDIFYDAVEIYSPGWFIEGQDPEAHLYEGDTSSDTRNSLIAKTMFRSGDMEAYGTGIGRIKELCDGAGIRVEYVKVPSGTKLIFHRSDTFESLLDPQMRESAGKCGKVRERYGKTVSEAEMAILEYIEEHGSITTSTVMQVTGLKERGSQKTLRRLMDSGIVKRLGASRNTRYILASDE